MSTPLTRPFPQDALEWCQGVTREHSQTFYLGSRLYPPRQREAVWAVYAACRIGDDLADDVIDHGGTPISAQATLDEWWQGVRRAYAGQPDDSAMGRALAWAVATYPVPLDAFQELYDGFCMDVQMDAGRLTYETLDDLQLYCRRVAGVVGSMIAPIGGYHGGEATLAAALKLGQAMQLTNILRDVGEDLRLGRVYLPQALMRQYGVTREDLQARRVTPQYRALLAHLMGVARDWYAQGRQGVPFLHGRARYGVAVAARLYAGILDELERNGFDNLTQRAVVPRGRKLSLLLSEVNAMRPHPDLCPLSWAERQYARFRAAR